MNSNRHGTILFCTSDLGPYFNINAPAMEAEHAYGITRPS